MVKGSIQTGVKSGLWIPRSALVYLGQTQIVWIKNGPVFNARKVSTGIINGNDVQVTAGLSVTDSIAQNAQYLTDSESFIKTGSHEN